MQTDLRLREVIVAFEASGVPYMVVGSIAGNAYGIPRSTQDADFIAECDTDALNDFASRLPDDFAVDRQMSFELRTTTTRKLTVEFPSKFKVEVFDVGDDPFDRERFARRVRELVGSEAVMAWVATGEDMLIQKIRWARDKDLIDAADYVAVSGPEFDWEYIERWAEEHGTTDRLEEVRRRVVENGGEA